MEEVTRPHQWGMSFIKSQKKNNFLLAGKIKKNNVHVQNFSKISTHLGFCVKVRCIRVGTLAVIQEESILGDEHTPLPFTTCRSAGVRYEEENKDSST